MTPRKKDPTPRKVTVQKDVEVELPAAPTVKDGEIAMRMVYSDGRVRDIIAPSMPEVVDKAMAQARKDGKNFQSARDVASWERVA